MTVLEEQYALMVLVFLPLAVETYTQMKHTHNPMSSHRVLWRCWHKSLWQTNDMFLINTIHKLDAAERFFQGRKEGRNRGWRKTMEPAEKKTTNHPKSQGFRARVYVCKVLFPCSFLSAMQISILRLSFKEGKISCPLIKEAYRWHCPEIFDTAAGSVSENSITSIQLWPSFS